MPEPFSLLLPLYRGDRPGFLTAAFVSSVHEQQRRPDEVVIVRDGPVGDGLADTLRELVANSPVPVILVELPDNVGLAAALTVGLEHCSFEIVARMDADDVSYPNRFAVQLPIIEQGFDVVGSAMHEFTAESGNERRIVGTRTPPADQEGIVRQIRFHNPFNHPSVVLRKSSVQRSGGYEALGTMEDYWLFARMVADGARVANVPVPLIAYRVDAGAYARRGGFALLSSEWRLQRAFRRRGITSTTEFVRNLLVRGVYRLVPQGIRRVVYRRAFVTEGGPVHGSR